MPDNWYTLSEFTIALRRNFVVYMDAGEPYARVLAERLLSVDSKEDAVVAYRATIEEFYAEIYFEINEDYMRMKRHDDLLERWRKTTSIPKRRDALERLIVHFDIHNYSGPPVGLLHR